MTLATSLIAMACALFLQAMVGTDEKSDPQIQAIISYFAKHGIKLEKAKEWGWHVVEPKLEGYYVLVNFRKFPPEATEASMSKELQQISLAHMLNVPAKLAMSYPGLRADAPGTPKRKPPDLSKLPIKDKMEKLFMEYQPRKLKK